MQQKTLETEEFSKLMREHTLNTIKYLFKSDQEFSVACEISAVHFEPSLPSEIHDTLPEITLFMIANYSFETASAEEGYLSFEAGFGSENIGALVQIPLGAIRQLFVEEYPILINVAPHGENAKDEEEKSNDEDNSMNALLNNPENAKLLKKKKK